MNKLEEQRRALLKSFLYALRGIRFCVKNERNMRIHISAAVCIAAFSFVYGLSTVEYGMLFFAIGFVIVAEMFNTGIEVVINLEMPSYHNLAKIGKDVAAGAVLVAAVTAILIGLSLFLRFPKLPDTLWAILTTPHLLIAFILLAGAGVLFAFWGNHLFRQK